MQRSVKSVLLQRWMVTPIGFSLGNLRQSFSRKAPPTQLFSGALPLREVMHKTGGAPEDVLNGRYPSSIWCVYCYLSTGNHHIEDEIHVLAHCPLYKVFKNRDLLTHKYTADGISSLFRTSDNNPNNLALIGEVIHNIMDLNQCYTNYYNSQDFHSNTGVCVML